MKKADKDGTLDLVRALNEHLSPEPLPDEELRTLFNERYPKLKTALDAIPATPGKPPDPTEKQLLTQILESVRALAGPIGEIAEETATARRQRAFFEVLRDYTARTPNVSAQVMTAA